jgi:hypothetical protein
MASVTDPETSTQVSRSREFEIVRDVRGHKYERIVNYDYRIPKRTIVLTALGRFTAFRQKYGVEP